METYRGIKLLIVVLLLAIVFSGCSSTSTHYKSSTDDNSYAEALAKRNADRSIFVEKYKHHVANILSNMRFVQNTVETTFRYGMGQKKEPVIKYVKRELKNKNIDLHVFRDNTAYISFYAEKNGYMYEFEIHMANYIADFKYNVIVPDYSIVIEIGKPLTLLQGDPFSIGVYRLLPGKTPEITKKALLNSNTSNSLVAFWDQNYYKKSGVREEFFAFNSNSEDLYFFGVRYPK